MERFINVKLEQLKFNKNTDTLRLLVHFVYINPPYALDPYYICGPLVAHMYCDRTDPWQA